LEIVSEIFRDLLIFVGAMFVLFIALIVVVSKLNDENPLKRVLSALSYRAAATLAVGAVALPVEFLPGIDTLYDIAAPIGLVWFWYTFFRDLYRGALPSGSRPPPSKPVKVQAR
jgi:predicted permease